MAVTQEWRGAINGLLYGLIFTPEITDEAIADYADAALNYTVLGSGPKVYYEAIQEALASVNDRTAWQLPKFDQAQIVGFLRGLGNRLDALRAWPEPKFVQLEASRWATFANAVPIARLDASIFGCPKYRTSGLRACRRCSARTVRADVEASHWRNRCVIGLAGRGGSHSVDRRRGASC
jgi:hypothetical protein